MKTTLVIEVPSEATDKRDTLLHRLAVALTANGVRVDAGDYEVTLLRTHAAKSSHPANCEGCRVPIEDGETAADPEPGHDGLHRWKPAGKGGAS